MIKIPVNKEIGIYCPDCKPLVKLVVKENHLNGNQFLGCPNYPDCRHTQDIPEHIRMEIQGQPKLF